MNLDDFLKLNKEILDFEKQLYDLNNKIYNLKLNKEKNIDSLSSDFVAKLFNEVNFKELITSANISIDISINDVNDISKNFTCCFDLNIKNISEEKIFAIENFYDILINGKEFSYCYFNNKISISFETKKELSEILNFFNVDYSKISFSVSDTIKNIINISKDLNDFNLEFI